MLEKAIRIFNENQGVLTLLMVLILFFTLIFSMFQYQIELWEYQKTVSVGLTYREYDPPKDWCSSYVSTFVITNYGRAWSSYRIEVLGNGLLVSKDEPRNGNSKIEHNYSIGPSEVKGFKFWIDDEGEKEEISFRIRVIDENKNITFYDTRFYYKRDSKCLIFTGAESLLEKKSKKFDLVFCAIIVSFILVVAILTYRNRRRRRNKYKNWQKDIMERGFR